MDPFRRYSRSKSKVVRNRAEFFSPSQILGGSPSKRCANVITPGSRHVVWIKICDDIPISPEIIDVYTLNFKPDLKFSPLNFFWGGGLSSQLGCALGRLGKSARVKISMRSTPKGRDIVCPKSAFYWVQSHI